MVTFDELLEGAMGIELEPLDENVLMSKTKLDSTIKDILKSYSDNGFATSKNGKVKLSIHNTKLERNIYTGWIKWTNSLDGDKYFKSIITKIKNAIRTEGFKNIRLDKDGKISIELTRADNNRIKNGAKKEVIDTAGTVAGAAIKL